MSTQHTPGPWRYVPDVSLHNTALVYGPDKFLVADAGRIHRRNPDETRANALLIAAAPDLLEALTLAVRYLEHPDVLMVTAGMIIPGSTVVEKFTDLLNKARGAG